MKPWLKLYRKMLFDRKYRGLDDDSRLAFFELLLASDDRGELYDIDRTSYMLHRSDSWVGSAIKQLIDCGWLAEKDDGYKWCKWQDYQETSAARRVRNHRERSRGTVTNVTQVTTVTDGNTCNQERELDREGEVESEKELPLGTTVPLSPSPAKTTGAIPVQAIVDLYNETCKPAGMVGTRVLSDKVRSAIKARWREDKERQSLEWWRWYFGGCAGIPGFCGKNERKWRANLEFVTRASKMPEILNESYQTFGMSKAEIRRAHNLAVIKQCEEDEAKGTEIEMPW